MLISKHIRKTAARALAVGAACLIWGQSVFADAPQRVVSINLCTDQLAMLLAADGQLHSVSQISLDRHVSPMADEAQEYRINYGQAEDVYLMQPDLVLAGVYTPQTTVSMLRNLGIKVEIFEISSSLDDVPAQLEKMGKALHRESAAQQLIKSFNARRAALAELKGPKPSAMLYYANGYTTGTGTLSHEILDLAGFRNAAVDAGYSWGMKMPLEVLTLAQPDLVITPAPYPGGSRAEDVTRHPAVRALQASRKAAAISDHDWVCGTPFVLRAAEQLAKLRLTMTDATQ